MKFDLDPPEHDETGVDGATTPAPVGSAAAEAPEEPGLRRRYRRAVDDTRSSLEQLRAHAWDHHLRNESQIHGATARDGSDHADNPEAWNGEGSDGALFRPDRLSGKARRTGGER
ncbi:hypothetical protein [Nocardiopsis salina]|uniref:hypothetical protein n=1 Tax=Nocardiopsis salina TaxID=245836 RepID=UPI00034D1760|nr:hypothetical protein [Nocardiopsis salina]